MDRFDDGDGRMDTTKKETTEKDTAERDTTRWDSIYEKFEGITKEELREKYNWWIEKIEILLESIKNSETPILDLGSGIGIDTLHLTEIKEGTRVIATELSGKALEILEKNVPEARTMKFDMKKGLNFGDELFEIILANKSIHYFSEDRTRGLVDELYRIIKPGGLFAFVVNSTKDTNFGAGQGVKLEENYYEVRGTTKRFFDEESLKTFFDSEHWEFVYMEEGVEASGRTEAVQMQTDGKQDNKKITWTCVVRRK